MNRTFVVPWWLAPFYLMIWLCCAVVMAVIATFVFTAQAGIWTLREIGRTLSALRR